MSISDPSLSRSLHEASADTFASPPSGRSLPLRVPLLYVTFRDQLLSPLVQGAVWGVVGLCLTQGKGALKAYLFAPRAQKRQGSGRGGSWWGNEGLRGLQRERRR